MDLVGGEVDGKDGLKEHNLLTEELIMSCLDCSKAPLNDSNTPHDD